MKRTLRQLIRLSRQHLDEKRREQAEIFARIDQTQAQSEALSQQMADEAVVAQADTMARMAYPGFARAAMDRRAALAEQIAALEREAEAKAEEIRQIFEEAKRYEIMLDRQEDAAKRAADRAEQADLDEIGLTRHDPAAGPLAPDP
ncbi:hypothetical protein CCR80_09335 [Rhodothalassium salexigens]|uniref:flagellar FliJ family protein n=1 Tax=Rhodothalassium salexigens TaxID=1086 RepID=UPI0019126131|nr:flagellar FliJ family protein [Rhodothalassium salexigens]MBK5921233.1 hypothetical protein [Rhodothalassium salexigens]